MITIKARNVNDAYTKGLEALWKHGRRENTRAGACMVMPFPVMTVYEHPMERILWDPKRNANPFFHLAESLWMLAGMRDARWLDQFVSDFSSRFAEEDGNQHGAYGYRWRWHFDRPRPLLGALDQLDKIIELLRINPNDRRIVLTMWDPSGDLGINKKDVPCNTQAYVRIRREMVEAHINSSTTDPEYQNFLDLTVTCRSNDLVWGAYGANAVHFSVLQEYLAARVGCKVGTYYQFSNNFHGYEATTPSEWQSPPEDYYGKVVRPLDMWNKPESIDDDLQLFFQCWVEGDNADLKGIDNWFLKYTAWPMLRLYLHRHELTQQDLMAYGAEHTRDWDIAAIMWLDRFLARKKKAKEKANVGK